MVKTNKVLSISFYLEMVAAAVIILWAVFSGMEYTPKNAQQIAELSASEMFVSIFIFVFMLLLALLLLLTILLTSRNDIDYDKDTVLYLALFIVLAASWIFLESGTLNAAFGNSIALYFAFYFAFYLMPVPFLFFARETGDKRGILYNIFAGCFLMSFAVNTVWMLAEDLVFPRTLVLVHILLSISIATCVVLGCIELFKYKNKKMYGMLIGICVLAAFALMDLVNFYINLNPSISIFLSTGLAIFMVILSAASIRRMVHSLIAARNFEEVSAETPVGIFRADNDERYTVVYANEEFYRMFGYPPEKAVALDAGEIIVHPEDFPRLHEEIIGYIAEGEYRFDLEYRHICKGGDVKWILSRCLYNPKTNVITAATIDISDRKDMEEQLRISKQEFQIAALQSDKTILRYDIKTKTAYQQTESANMFGIPDIVENVPDSIIEMGIIAPDSIATYIDFYEAMRQGEPTGSASMRIMNAQKGDYSWYHRDFSVIFGDDGEPQYSIISTSDITEQREKELAYERTRQEISNAAPEEFSTFECNLTRDTTDNINGNLLGSLGESGPVGFNMRTAIRSNLVHPDDRQKYIEFMNREHLLASFELGVYNQTMDYRRRIAHDSGYRWLRITVQLVRYPDSNEIKAFVMVRDVDKEKSSELEIRERSRTDALTGILNRTAFTEEVDLLLAGSGADVQHAFVMVDLDKFKQVNDTLGHYEGDQLLLRIVNDMRSLVREGDLLARIGGDEFIFCFKKIPNEQVIAKRAEMICRIIYEELEQGITISGSIGISMFPNDGFSFEELYKKADAAMYSAKNKGPGQYVFYNEDMGIDSGSAVGTPIDQEGDIL